MRDKDDGMVIMMKMMLMMKVIVMVKVVVMMRINTRENSAIIKPLMMMIKQEK